MKGMLIFTLWIVVLACSSSPAETDLHRPDKLALTVIIDTSWSCENEIPQFRTLATQSAGGLTPGDYLEVISAHAGTAKIRYAQIMKTGDPDEVKAVASALEGIHTSFLTWADIGKALELAFKRLEKVSSQKGFMAAAVIVFTDGKLSANETRGVLQLAAKFEERGWALYLTGTKGSNRALLIAANQGKLRWSLLSEANPQMWLQKEIRPEPKCQEIELGPESKQILETGGPVGTETPSDRQAVQIPDLSLDTPVEPNIPGSWEQPFFEQEPVDEIVTQTPLAVELNEPAPESAAQTDEEISAQSGWWQSLGTKLRIMFGSGIIVAMAVLAVVGLVVSATAVGRRQAGDWDKKVSSRLKGLPSQDTGTLVAKLNGRTHHLGRLDHLKAVHIGSGPKNTIRVQDKAISERHVRIYRHSRKLMLRNIGRAPIAVSGSPVKPGGKHRIVMPSVIQLNDKTKISLARLRPKAHSGPDRSDENDRQ